MNNWLKGGFVGGGMGILLVILAVLFSTAGCWDSRTNNPGSYFSFSSIETSGIGGCKTVMSQEDKDLVDSGVKASDGEIISVSTFFKDLLVFIAVSMAAFGTLGAVTAGLLGKIGGSLEKEKIEIIR